MSAKANVLALARGLLLSKLGSSLIGVLLLVALIWYAGPLVGIGAVASRLYLIGGLLALTALVLGIRHLLARRRGARLQTELASQSEGGDAQRAAEIESIREKMNEAIASLKASQLGAGYRGSAALYALPWYMIIGPSAAGKSTLLRQSGLQFPYANADDLHLKGFGGTRNCDWWFSDQAILLDTAGRYTTEEDDSEEWLAFLQLLRRNRPKMPINGVLACISVSDLLTADSAEMERHVKILRERINELMRQLGLVFPVFIVFTKCDLIHGFEAFFEDLSEHERKQVWGAYLLEAVEGQEPAAQFEQKMGELYAKLCELRIRKLTMQRNLARKGLLFDFPNQFDAAAEKLTEFVRLLLRSNPYQDTPRFAGVYFTSGTQEGTPLQRLVGNLRHAFGFAEDTGARTAQPKAYFIRQLFTDVIFQLQGFAHGNRRRLLIQRSLKSATVAGALGTLGAAAVLLTGSFAANSMLLAHGTSVAADLRQSVGTERELALHQYQKLEAVYEHHQTLLKHQRQRPWVSYIGVYTGQRQIPVLESLLAESLERMFRDRVYRSLEHRLENLARLWETADKEGRERLRDNYYEALRVYLMTTRVRSRLEIDGATPLLSTLWAQQLGLARSEQSYSDVQHRAPQLDRLVRVFLAAEPTDAWPVRADLIAQAQGHLRTPPNAEQLYAQIVNKGRVQFPDRKIDGLLTGQNRGLLVSEGKIEGVYTARAWTGHVRTEIAQVIENATRGDWVLSEDLDALAGPDARHPEVVDHELAQQLEHAIREMYFRDYADAWLRFLESVSPRRFDSLADATATLMLLARSDGPIGELMQVTATNINLTERESASRLRELPGVAERLGEGLAGARIAELDMRLTDLRRFTNAAEQKSVSELVHQYLLVLSSLKNEVERLAASMDVPREAQAFAGTVLGSGGSNTELYKGWITINGLLSGTDVRTRQALQPLLVNPIRHTWAQVLTEARVQLEQDWLNAVVSPYRQQIGGQFPFAPQGPDAALSDVAEFFRPGDGVLWAFVDQSLTPFIVEQRQGWQERRWLNMGLGFNRSMLNSLGQARMISQSLFRRGGADPDLTFYVYPVPVQGLSEMVLETNGQVYRYRNEPQEWRRFAWPGQNDRIGARVSGVSGSTQARGELRAGGPWGLFHLLNSAKLTSEGGTVYLTEWDLEVEGQPPLKVRFRIRADRQDNVFRQQMNTFRLPSALFAGSEVAVAGAAR